MYPCKKVFRNNYYNYVKNDKYNLCYSPQGKKFQFKWKLRRYLERTKSTLSAEQFHFGLYKRAKSSLVPPVIERKQENLNFNKKTVFTKDKSQPISNSSKTILLSKGKGFNIKGSNVVSSSQTKKRLNQCKEKTDLKNVKQGL